MNCLFRKDFAKFLEIMRFFFEMFQKKQNVQNYEYFKGGKMLKDSKFLNLMKKSDKLLFN